jgi:hypothetical protein
MPGMPARPTKLIGALIESHDGAGRTADGREDECLPPSVRREVAVDPGRSATVGGRKAARSGGTRRSHWSEARYDDECEDGAEPDRNRAAAVQDRPRYRCDDDETRRPKGA